jgi:hypothetical protein
MNDILLWGCDKGSEWRVIRLFVVLKKTEKRSLLANGCE